ncbi:MAG: ATP-binding protein [Paenibacillus sp.]|nr:ATP-binding protein [Paenibacillus sp.]
MKSLVKQKVNIRPTSGVYATYKRLSYQPWTAIAEFVDNSTQSFFDNYDCLIGLPEFNKLRIEINYEEGKDNKDKLTILDNAFGMEIEEFKRAIILDKPPINKSGRNEFGMGLKTAACWFGDLWVIESTQYGSNNLYRATVDVNLFQVMQVEEIDIEIYRVSTDEHYTNISITRLNQKIKGSRTKAKVKDLLRSIYRQDIRTDTVEISYNGEKLQYKDPDIYFEKHIDGTIEKFSREVSFDIEHEGKTLHVEGFVAIRIPASLKEAGITLIRRGRVIIGGPEKNYRPIELFGDPNSYAYQRVFGELHMDNWPVTQAKDDFDWHNSGLEEIFIEKLKRFTKPLRDKAQIVRIREKIDTNQIIPETFSVFHNTGLIINPVLVTKPTSEPQNTSNEDNSGEVSFNSKHNLINYSNPSDVILDIDNNRPNDWTYIFTHNEQEFTFVIELELKNISSQWLLITPMEGVNVFQITINMRHPFFSSLLHNKEFIELMTRFVIGLALAEIEAGIVNIDGKIEPSSIRLKMNKILQTIANNGGGNNNEH